MAAIQSDDSQAVTAPFDLLFRDLGLEAIYLLEVDSYNPDTGAVQTNRYSGTGFKSAFNDTPADTVYASRMDQDPKFTRAMTREGAIGGSAIPALGSVRLLNNDGGLDSLLSHGFDSRGFLVKMGVRGSTLAEFGTVLSATMIRAFSTETIFEIALRDPSLQLQTAIQPVTYGEAISTRNLATVTGAAVSTLTLSDYKIPFGDNQILVVIAGGRDANAQDAEPASVAFGVDTPTKSKGTFNAPSGADNVGVGLFYLLEDSGGWLDRTDDIVVTFPATVDDCWAMAFTLIGAKQQAPEATSSSETDAAGASSTSITTITASALVVDAVSKIGTGDADPTSPQVTLAELVPNNTRGMVSTVSPIIPAAQTLTWTADSGTNNWAHIAAAFEANSGVTAGHDDIFGQPVPLTYGQVSHVPLVLVDPANLIFQGHFGQIESFDAVYDNGAALNLVGSSPSAGEYTVDLTLGTVTLGGSAVGLITADMKGSKEGGTYVNTHADIVRRIIAQQGSDPLVDPDDLDTPAFDIFNSQELGVCGIHIPPGDGNSTVADIVTRLISPIEAFWGFTRLGKFQLFLFELPSGSTNVRFDLTNIVDIRVVPQGPPFEFPASEVKVGYDRLGVTQDPNTVAATVTDAERARLSTLFRTAVTRDKSVEQKHPLAVKPDPLPAYYVNEVNAQAKADAILPRHKVLRKFIQMTVRHRPFQLEVNDIASITYPRFGFNNPTRVRVTAIRDNEPQGLVSLELWG